MYGTDGRRLYLRLDLLADIEFTQINLGTDRLCVPLLDNPDTEVARDKILRSEEHTSELQSHLNIVCRLLLENKPEAPAHIKDEYVCHDVQQAAHGVRLDHPNCQ